MKETPRKLTSQEGGFFNFLRPWISAGLQLIKKVVTPLAKNVLMPLGLSQTDAVIQNKILGSGTTALIIWNIEINNNMKIFKSLEESGLLTKSLSETIKNEAKEQKGGFLGILLGTLGACLLGSIKIN